jgi:hypothetical protein
VTNHFSRDFFATAFRGSDRLGVPFMFESYLLMIAIAAMLLVPIAAFFISEAPD